jgi:hypothetical protein
LQALWLGQAVTVQGRMQLADLLRNADLRAAQHSLIRWFLISEMRAFEYVLKSRQLRFDFFYKAGLFVDSDFAAKCQHKR